MQNRVIRMALSPVRPRSGETYKMVATCTNLYGATIADEGPEQESANILPN